MTKTKLPYRVSYTHQIAPNLIGGGLTRFGKTLTEMWCYIAKEKVILGERGRPSGALVRLRSPLDIDCDMEDWGENYDTFRKKAICKGVVPRFLILKPKCLASTRIRKEQNNTHTEKTL